MSCTVYHEFRYRHKSFPNLLEIQKNQKKCFCGRLIFKIRFQTLRVTFDENHWFYLYWQYLSVSHGDGLF